MLSIARRGGARPPASEVLDVHEDGTFSLWRTVSTATQPSTPVGRSTGTLDAADLEEVRAAVASATGAAPPGAAGAPAGSLFDRITVGGVECEASAESTVDGGWSAAFAVARRLLQSLAVTPTAGLDLRVADAEAALVHVGSEPMDVDLSELRITVGRLEDGAAVEHWGAEMSGPFSATAEPGWSFALPFQHPFAGSPLSAAVEGFMLHDGTAWLVCEAASLDQADPRRSSG